MIDLYSLVPRLPDLFNDTRGEGEPCAWDLMSRARRRPIVLEGHSSSLLKQSFQNNISEAHLYSKLTRNYCNFKHYWQDAKESAKDKN